MNYQVISKDSDHDAVNEYEGILHSSSDDKLASNGEEESLEPQIDPSTKKSTIKSFRNFVYFSILYSTTHGTVDAVLAFSTAELGTVLGSYGGFTLYIFYTMSALLLAKPFLRSAGAKSTVLIGLIGLLAYVASFFVALLVDGPSATPIFLVGAAIGGIGAGLLWTGQGSYYTLNAKDYATKSNIELENVLVSFSTIFAGTYLLLETGFKASATLVYVSFGSNALWRPVVFGFYTCVSVASVIAFSAYILAFDDDREVILQTAHNDIQTDNEDEIDTTTFEKPPDPMKEIWNDLTGVMRAIMTRRLLQLIIPFQLCFGFASGLVDYYICGIVVNEFIGDGYIGILTAITTLTAVALMAPYYLISNNFVWGSWSIMIFGGCCFLYVSTLLLFETNQELGTWQQMVPYFVVYGAARGAWESINKAVVAKYFNTNEVRDIAFATIYFTSGLAGAISFMTYRSMTRNELVILNIVISIVALVTYQLSLSIREENVDDVIHSVNDSSSHDDRL